MYSFQYVTVCVCRGCLIVTEAKVGVRIVQKLGGLALQGWSDGMQRVFF